MAKAPRRRFGRMIDANARRKRQRMRNNAIKHANQRRAREQQVAARSLVPE